MAKSAYRTNYELYGDLPPKRSSEIDMILAQAYPHMSHYFCSHCCYNPEDSCSSFADSCSYASHGSIDFYPSRSDSDARAKLKSTFRRILGKV